MYLTNLLVPSEELLARARIPCAALCNLEFKNNITVNVCMYVYRIKSSRGGK